MLPGVPVSNLLVSVESARNIDRHCACVLVPYIVAEISTLVPPSMILSTVMSAGRMKLDESNALAGVLNDDALGNVTFAELRMLLRSWATSPLTPPVSPLIEFGSL